MDYFVQYTYGFHGKDVGMYVTDAKNNDYKNSYTNMLDHLVNYMGFECLREYVGYCLRRCISNDYPIMAHVGEGPVSISSAGDLYISRYTSTMYEIMSYFERVFGTDREDYPVYLMVPTAKEIKRARGGAICMSWVWFCQDWDDSIEFV